MSGDWVTKQLLPDCRQFVKWSFLEKMLRLLTVNTKLVFVLYRAVSNFSFRFVCVLKFSYSFYRLQIIRKLIKLKQATDCCVMMCHPSGEFSLCWKSQLPEYLLLTRAGRLRLCTRR